MAIQFSSSISISNDLLVRELDGESVLLNLDNESYYGLDKVGTHMWNVLANSSSLEDSFNKLLSEYDVDPEQLRTDMQELIEQLVENGLIRINHADAA